jgi:hypothetical protein
MQSASERDSLVMCATTGIGYSRCHVPQTYYYGAAISTCKFLYSVMTAIRTGSKEIQRSVRAFYVDFTLVSEDKKTAQVR